MTLTFTDGSTETADCLIGADGIHSVTRKYILGKTHPAADPVNHDRWYRLGKIAPMEEVKRHLSDRYLGFVPILCGPRGYFNMMPLNYGKTVSTGVILRAKTDKDIGKFPNDDCFDGYDEDCQRMYRLIRPDYDQSNTWVLQDQDAAPFYHKGRVVMIGDAAHATLPFIGNGAAQAIEDAAVLHALFAELKHKDQFPDLLAGFDHTRRPRATKVAQLSRDAGRLYNFDFGDAWREADGIDKLKEHFRRIASLTNDADLAVQNQQAIDAFRMLQKGKS